MDHNQLPAGVGVTLLTREDVGRVLQLTGRTISRLLAETDFPRPLMVGRSYRWRMEDLTHYLDRQAGNRNAPEQP